MFRWLPILRRRPGGSGTDPMSPRLRGVASRVAWRIAGVVLAALLTGMVLLVTLRNAEAAQARSQASRYPVKDVDPRPYAFTTKRLPRDDRLMCSVGNGHISTNIFSQSVYMNALYNGRKGRSHRARVPAWCNVRLNSSLPQHAGTPPNHTLDVQAASYVVHVDREYSNVEQRIYAHRYYTRAIVNQIVITAKHHAEMRRDHQARYVELSFLPGPPSKDITFDEPQVFKIGDRVLWITCGKTNEVEDSRYQEELSEVCACWTHVPARLAVPRRGNITHTFVMTVDSRREVVLKEMTDALQESDENLYCKHREAWADIYKSGNIEISGNTQLAKTVNAAWYYLLSSLPSFESNQQRYLFFGLSPGGLSRGDVLKDYEGHNFWDTEIWMLPVILMLQPNLAELLLRYRIAMRYAAGELAKEGGHKGIRFSWESAFTGREVTQPCCPEVAEFEHHITACVSFAVRQYISVTGDEEFLKERGCEMIMQIAEFWESRAEYNETSGFYDIKHVMGPDEDHENITNSVFTNVMAGYALYLGHYASCLCSPDWIKPWAGLGEGWAELASRLALPYDPSLDYHPQYEGYTRPTKIKQADAVLLGYPIQYLMNQSTRANDLNYYENVTRPTGPAMTWGMHAVGNLRLGLSQRAEQLFNKSYQGYTREPFHTWTEYQKPRVGAVNFLTGMGGFLQAILFGYAGLRIHLDKLEIISPQVIPNTSRLKIQGLKYLGGDFILDIDPNNTKLKVLSTDEKRPLIIVIKYNNKIPLSSGITVMLHGEGPFEIRSAVEGKCPLPLDLIGQIKPRMTFLKP